MFTMNLSPVLFALQCEIQIEFNIRLNSCRRFSLSIRVYHSPRFRWISGLISVGFQAGFQPSVTSNSIKSTLLARRNQAKSSFRLLWPVGNPVPIIHQRAAHRWPLIGPGSELNLCTLEGNFGAHFTEFMAHMNICILY
jgi:hypothetical protein